MLERKIRILFVTACPNSQGTLRADNEFKQITQVITGFLPHEPLELEMLPAATSLDLSQKILHYAPDVIHFSVHGGLDLDEHFKAIDIGFHDDGEGENWVGIDDLCSFLSVVKKRLSNLRLVVFNSCASSNQASQVAEIVGCAIGTVNNVKNETSTAFSKLFYQSLGHDKEVLSAFEFAKESMRLEKDVEPESFVLMRQGEAQQPFNLPANDFESLDDDALFQYCLQLSQSRYGDELNSDTLAANIFTDLSSRDASLEYLTPILYSVDENNKETIRPPEQLMEASARSIVVGRPGIGKSTFLNKLAAQAIKQNLLPVMVDLREYKIPTSDSDAKPWEYSISQLNEIVKEGEQQIPPGILNRVLPKWASEGKLLVAFDSIDESQPDTFIHYLRNEIKGLADAVSPVVITCRFQEFRADIQDIGFQELRLRVNKEVLLKSAQKHWPKMDVKICKQIAEHKFAETPMGFQLLIHGAKESGSTPILDDETLHAIRYDLEESEHLNNVVKFLIDPAAENEEFHQFVASQAIIDLKEQLFYFAQFLAATYRDHVVTDTKLNREIATSIVNDCLEQIKLKMPGLTVRSEEIVEYFEKRKLIIVGQKSGIRFIHDLLAQTLANSLKGLGPAEHGTLRLDTEPTLQLASKLQGNRIENWSARSFSRTIRGAIKDILLNFSETPIELWNDSIGRRGFAKEFKATPTSTVCFQFVDIIHRFRLGITSSVDDAEKIEEMTSALEELLELLEVLPSETGTSKEAIREPSVILFIEYLVGLGFFELTGILGETFLASLGQSDRRMYKPKWSYASGLEYAFTTQGNVIGNINSQLDFSQPEETWKKIFNYYCRLPYQTKQILDRVVGMRYIPQRSEFMSLAQILHWDGWGGNGQTCNLVFGHQNDPVSQVLAKNAAHAFDWHGIGPVDESSRGKATRNEPNHEHEHEVASNFSNRHRMFSVSANQLKQILSKCIAALLTNERFANGVQKRYRIWGDGVGPTFKAELDLIQAISGCLTTRKPTFDLCLTEMSGPSLDGLFDTVRSAEADNRWNIHSTTIYFRDLNRPFFGEPNSSIPLPAELYSAFDCYSCAIALHQVADQEFGHNRIREIMSFATKVVRPGGVISIPDVGVGVNLQLFLIPINLVDREGGWGLDVFSPTFARKPLFKFKDVSVSSSNENGSMNPDKIHLDLLKVPIPIVALAAGTPFSSASRGFAMYESIPYLIIELTQSKIDELQMEWDQARSIEELIEIADKYICLWRPEASDWKHQTENDLAKSETLENVCTDIYKSRWLPPTPE